MALFTLIDTEQRFHIATRAEKEIPYGETSLQWREATQYRHSIATEPDVALKATEMRYNGFSLVRAYSCPLTHIRHAESDINGHKPGFQLGKRLAVVESIT